MSELKTLSRHDPEFLAYLLGSFSKTHRAIPIKTLNAHTKNETVTFSIQEISTISRPQFFSLWAQVLKIQHFILVAFPLFLILVKLYLDEVKYDPYLAILSGLGAVFLQAAVNLRNDYLDHLSGLDRLQDITGSRAIQSGWVTAIQVKRISNILLFLGLLLGLPSLIVFPELIYIIAALLGLGFIGMQSYRFGLKYRLWTELTAFLLLGPFLTIGYQLAIGAGFDLESLFLGIINGWLAVYVVHIKNFSQIMTSNQVGFVNSITFLGFEKAKTLLRMWWLIFVFLVNIYHFFYSSFAWALSLMIFSFLLTYFQWLIVGKIHSPVDSKFHLLLKSCYKIALVLLTFWVFELTVQILRLELRG